MKNREDILLAIRDLRGDIMAASDLNEPYDPTDPADERIVRDRLIDALNDIVTMVYEN